jgi:hypothetical protein
MSLFHQNKTGHNMLKSTQPKPNQVVCFKLVSGEEMIAKVKSRDDNAFVVSAARTLVPMQNNSAGLAPIASMGEPNGELHLSKAAVMFIYAPLKDIEVKYQSEVSSIAVAGQATNSNKIL